MAEKSITDLPQGMITKILLHHAITASTTTPTLLSILNPPRDEYGWLDMAMEELEVDIIKSGSGDPELQRQQRRQLIAEASLGQDLLTSALNFDRLVIPPLFERTGVISSCNGIICLANPVGNVAYLWNPSIKQYKKVPPPNLNVTTSLLRNDIGFGYDFISNDYKEGMITEVLVRLPVKTVLQCKSVCKPWLSIISNPHFIKSQLHHAIVASQNNPTLLTLAKPPPTEAELLSLSFVRDLTSPYPFHFATLAAELQHQKKRQLIDEALLDVNGQDLSSSPVHFDRVVIPRVFYPHIQIVGSCNGVICLSGMGARVIYLWNPSIRQCKKLDTAPTRQTSSAVDIGFGYDSVSKDYKVLTVVYEQNADANYSTNAN
ncbi:hypothetical protein POM88_008729 [Heracleum sosnowskyi]|uniref:F-box domain-containing protein n=1 Tax=Heracleum sosnowskyi TaxID=360622 RepID=A0AAD8N7M6_9APIA|nr:hypothetical protein POM88_008729 [Heracleum sosnowskyi]